ncbi:peptidoglycan-binding domain-containing protein [Phytomonospora endophytica]|uniref:Peptidoglycan binding-like domain-containing protein n=1 Tax=Phytomonospora endophytica TaxID=714109 RepID=A0A841FTS0_9ACTN|nr:peptidoglycan-binding domain-containing protein [Phytomonospora endophytica]MBB6036942.1 hypothetical protein [Phytomonospora endophytica]GIG68027.1 hypothetical protein Pen01_43220 [Phytomonospora endophytica]
MGRHSLGRLALATAAGTALIAGVTNVPGAHADASIASTTEVDGAGALTDDFHDNYDDLGGSLCHGCANSSNTDAVILWQSILAVDGFLTANKSTISGSFGTQTRDATKAWQTARGLSADGKVGDATWSMADNNLIYLPSGAIQYRNPSGNGYVSFLRGGEAWADGTYALYTTKAMDGTSVNNQTSRNVFLFKRTIVFN